ncbi:hypothetical protein ABPG75_006491 [Micractinium tetrahymenae]
MNCEAARLVEAREEEVQRLGGLEAYRLQALRNLKLKTVVKESHASPVHTLVLNHTSLELGNLFATVGADQATVYDGEHMGDHVAVVAHFTNAASDHAPGGGLQAAAWLSAAGWSEAPAGDACLAVAGADPNISVISVVEARVVRLLRGHTREMVELAAAPAAPRLLLSLSRDGNLRLWDVPSEACLSSLQTEATCIAMAPDARSVLLGTSRGKLQQYDITTTTAAAAPAAAAAATVPAAEAAAAAGAGGGAAQGPAAAAAAALPPPSEPRPCLVEGSRREVQCLGSCHSDALDCLRFLPGGRLASKSTDGRMFVWRLGGSEGSSSGGDRGSDSWQLEMAATWKVPACSGAGGLANRCQFGCTADGRFIAAGNSKGDCFVYDSESGERVAHVSAIRVSAPVRACGLSEDCRHLMAVLGKGFVFRFEYHGPLAGAATEQQDSGPTGSGEEMEGKKNKQLVQQEAA